MSNAATRTARLCSMAPFAAFVLLLNAGCVTYRLHEIDATNIPGFEWTGKIRVVERCDVRLFGNDYRRVRVELVGQKDRNIVVYMPHPIWLGGNSSDPRTRLEARVQDVGRPPERILKKLTEDDPVLKQIGQLVCCDSEAPPNNRNVILEAAQRTMEEYTDTGEHLNRREFDQISAKQPAFYCALTPSMHLESTYQFGSNTCIHVSVSDQDCLEVWIEDSAGEVLYRWEPVQLQVRQLDEAPTDYKEEPD